MPVIILLLLLGIALIAGPIVASSFHHPLGVLTQLIMSGFGVLLITLASFALIISNLYRKTKASEAFVRTGMGGLQVIMDGGAYVVPVVHQLVRVSLMTFRLEIRRELKDSLITKDNLRADIYAEFFVRVPAVAEQISTAARSFGDVTEDNLERVKKLIEDKLVSALRNAAVNLTLEELNTKRNEFLESVTGTIGPDLAHNGLVLEAATISKLDQTDASSLRDDNIFDAQGKRKIIEITQQQKTNSNLLERKGEQERAQQDLATRQQILNYDQTRAEAEATQASSIAKSRAEQDRLAKEAEIEAQRQIELAAVEKGKMVAVAEMKKTEATEVAERDKRRAVTVADQALEVANRDKAKAITQADQQVEVANRAKEQAIANAERDRAKAEAEKATAEAEREKERQGIETVKVEATANRDKTKKVLEATADAEQKFVTAQRAADAQAYSVQKEAEGRKAAAEADADALTKRAEADAKSKEAQARGDKAVAMVPIDVAREQVNIDKARIETVVIPDLQAREKHGQVAQEFELGKLRIEQQALVQIEIAKASATYLQSVTGELRIFGTPEQMQQFTGSVMRGMGIAGMAEGLLSGGDDGTKAAVGQLGTIVRALAKKAGIELEAPVSDPPIVTSSGTTATPVAAASPASKQ